ncbi:MAG: MBOAT family protein [Marinilabiliaceae bacterium]|nr:MBOAT family protein [Marinilabiliaceae bacterium]
MKYANFAIDPFLAMFGDDIKLSVLSKWIIPIGISYFTLQGIGYLINLKLGWEKPEKDLFKFLLYILYFPKFLSGPIERSNHFLPQLNKPKYSLDIDFSIGIKVLLIGLFKKIAIANQLAPYIFKTLENIQTTDGVSVWMMILLLPVYLYFDFSGYTDIAIGISRMFGIEVVQNFNRPFLSENMTMFWKRFHISLSSWFNDYIFKQVSFRRRKWGVYAAVYAVFLTWVLFGIWHGAGWNFMALGFLQALAIIYEYFTKRWRARFFSYFPMGIKVWLGRLLTYLFYAISLVFFFSPDVNTTMSVFSRIIVYDESIFNQLIGLISVTSLSVFVFMFIMLFVELLEEDYSNIYKKIKIFWDGQQKRNMLFRWSVYSIVLTIIFVLGNNVQQFIYSQF